MKASFFTRLVCAAIVLLLPGVVVAQTDDELFYTYAGFMLEGGASSLDWSGWTGQQRENITYGGWYTSGGAVLQVNPRPLLGEVSCLWSYNSDDCEDHPLWYMRWQGLLKYSWELVPVFHLTGGLGLYAETPPAAGDYDGGGLAASLGGEILLSDDWRVFFDCCARYGNAAAGEGSRKANYGLQFGVVRKVGRI